MSSSVRDTDHGFKQLKKTLESIKGSKAHVKVGVLAGGRERTDGALSNVDVAMIHEYGAPSAGIPERSFIRSSLDKHRPEYEAMLSRGLKKITEGKMDVDQALGLVGAKAAADMKRGITGDGIHPPNAPSTIKAKGSSRPLVDTGQLVQSITFEVVKGEE